MTGISYDIVIKDFATSTLSKLQKSSLKTEGAVRKMLRSLPEGSKNATPSIDSLRFKLDKLPFEFSKIAQLLVLLSNSSLNSSG